MIGEGTSAPDLIEPVIAYREWRVQQGQLASPHVGERWRPGWMVARHREGYMGIYTRPVAHDAPAKGCMCGLYGWFDPHHCIAGHVIGAVAMAGRLQVHESGARAERARIVALSPGRFATLAFSSHLEFPSFWRWVLGARAGDGLVLTRKGRRDFEVLCDRYEAECVWDPADLPAVAEKYGKPVPASLRMPQAEAA